MMREQSIQYFRRLAKLLHPDKNQHPLAKEAFQKLSEAFQVVSASSGRAACWFANFTLSWLCLLTLTRRSKNRELLILCNQDSRSENRYSILSFRGMRFECLEFTMSMSKSTRRIREMRTYTFSLEAKVRESESFSRGQGCKVDPAVGWLLRKFANNSTMDE